MKSNKLYYRKSGQPYDTPFRIERGLNGSIYAVFDCEYDAEDFADNVLQRGDAVICCFGGFLNAVVLEDNTHE